ncbi:MAG TPA: SRPBCC family protein [Devosiaceae bacterium]
MNAKDSDGVVSGRKRTRTERTSERELVVTRSFDASPHIVFKAWTTPELFMRWWAPKSFGITLLSCEMDVRTGGTYRLEFGHPSFDQPMAFHGKYIEVVPDTRLVWTNEEEDEGSVTTATFEARGAETLVIVHDLYPSKDALDAAIASGSTGAYPEQFEELDAILAGLGEETGQP